MTTKQQLTIPTEGITCHSWNKDRSMVAICPNNNEIHIYNASNWNRVYLLTEHDLLVSSIDWCHANNKIVSCSHDRNAFVWTFDPDQQKWVPALVILRIDRAALHVKWSADGVRFAVASSAKSVPVCTYEGGSDWWVSKMIKKKFKSSVSCVAFHPNNGQILATGSTDFRCRVYSTFTSEVDTAGPNAGDFVKPLEFGEVYCELVSSGWITALAWSPSGRTLAFTGHDSSIHFATFAFNERSGNVASHNIVRFRFLPLSTISFVSETAVVAAGHDFNPAVFVGPGDNWNFLQFVDQKREEKKAAVSDGFASSRALFANKTSKGQDSTTDTLWTQHEAAITDLQVISRDRLSTVAMDGRLVLWDLPALDISMATLGL